MTSTLEEERALNDPRCPIVLRVAESWKPDGTVYDYDEAYSHKTQKLGPGEYFMGSPKRNTRCNKFTIIGADRQHNDDTKEKR